ncbi:MAG: hypothetical protein CL843_16100 [Crocinitomicaceae bacterium]|nr:hypothetical protein [Crocinitomicaceae bacterium]|tara:strand:+ start:7212 stop:8285 length:1074 start_codon:yes stop_codon:yes gene_type:complete
MEINKIIEQINHLNIFHSDKYMHDFNFLSVALKHLLPSLSLDDHLQIAKKCSYYQILSSHDENNYDLIKSIDKPHLDLSNKIIVTYHYSSYRLLNSLLINWGIPFKIVTDNNYIKNQGEKTIQSYHKIASNLQAKPHQFEILNAEERTILLKCKKAISDGYSLIFYADGNSGVGGMTKKNNMIKINFLENEIYVRKGIAILSSILKKPLTSILLSRDLTSNNVTFSIEDNIQYLNDRKNEKQLEETVRKIWRPLEKQVSNDPGQWEGWLYYYNFINFQNKVSKHIEPVKKSVFNCTDFGIGHIPKQNLFYLLDKKEFKFTLIDQETYKNLHNIIKTNKIPTDYPVYESMRKKGILTS